MTALLSAQTSLYAMRAAAEHLDRRERGRNLLIPFIEAQARTGTLWMEVDSGNDGPVFLAPHAQQQLGISIPAHNKRQVDIDVVGLGRVSVTAASRDLIYDGQLNPTFLRQVQLTIDFGRGKAWARFDNDRSR